SYDLDWLDNGGLVIYSVQAELPLGIRSTLAEDGPCEMVIPEEGVIIIRISGPDGSTQPSAVRLTQQAVAGRAAQTFDLPPVFTAPQIDLPIQSFSSDGALLDGPLSVTKIRDTGPDANRLVIVVMGDGYTSANLLAGIFEDDATLFLNSFGSESPWDLLFGAVNVYRIDIESNEEGADHEIYGVLKDTYLNSSFWVNGIERLLALNSTGYSRAYSAANSFVGTGVWDHILVLVNTDKYGGSGGTIAVTSMHPSAPDIILHELGHSFGQLADEYESAYPGYPPGDYEPNVDYDFSGPGLKWNIWVEAGTPLPTPENSAYGSVVGAFEGARYLTTGIYRPWYVCLMRALGVAFGPVCKEAHVMEFFDVVTMADDVFPTEGSIVPVDHDGETFGITPLPVSNLAYRWRLDGVVVPTELGPEYLLTNEGLPVGQYDLELRVTFASSLVRQETISATYQWVADVSSGGCCVGLTGNVDNDVDDICDIGDLTALIDYMFISFTPPVCMEEANTDGDIDGIVDMGDLTTLIDFLFITFTPPAACQAAGSPSGGVIDHSSCKSIPLGDPAVDTTDEWGCVEWSYDGSSVLSLTHVNAGFNCCPIIAADLRFEGDTIIVEELDSLDNGGCACLCLFDVDYEINSLPPGQYRILVIEPYLPTGDPPLDFWIDLSSTPAGIHCESRTEYPWAQP
ncbi:MAG: hypothetical protein JSU65_03940, partial [Candidatus Zixiibacteriota bacterium]